MGEADPLPDVGAPPLIGAKPGAPQTASQGASQASGKSKTKPNTKADADFVVARQLWKQGKAEACRERLEKILDENPLHRDAVLLRAECDLLDQRPEAALPSLVIACREHPKDAQLMHTMGVVLEAMGRRDRAVGFYRRATELAPHVALYRQSLKLYDSQESQEDHTRLADRGSQKAVGSNSKPRAERVAQTTGRSMRNVSYSDRSGTADRAAGPVNEADLPASAAAIPPAAVQLESNMPIDDEPADAASPSSLGSRYAAPATAAAAEDDDADEAAEDSGPTLRFRISDKPKSSPSKLPAASAAVGVVQDDSSSSGMPQRSLAQGPASAAEPMIVEHAPANVVQPAAAFAAPAGQTAIVKAGPASPPPQIIINEHALAESPPAADVSRQIEEALARGEMPSAAGLIRQAESDHPEDEDIPIAAAVAALRNDRADFAVETLQAAAVRFPGSARLHRVLGTAYYRQGQYAAAEVVIRQALDLDKSSAVAYFLMGSTLSKLGRISEAHEYFRQARALDPELVSGR
jgi:tetratricopeptide (TPR) repeat protein